MSNDEAVKQMPDQIKPELSKDDLLKYVELDLWNRFQERLWKVVGVFLTLVTVVGLLGVPYYIKSEVTAHLQKREKEFTDKTDEMVAYSKLLAVLRARYDSERYRFDGDMLRVVSALAEARKSGPDTAKKSPRFNDPENELVALVSRHDFAQVTEGSFMAGEAFVVPPEMKDKNLVPPTTITIENKGVVGAGGYMETHPVRNGTYGGIIKDLRYRIVVLEGLRRAIDSLQEKMLSLGGTSVLERRVQVVRVNSIEATEFHDLFSDEMASIAKAFLTADEQKEFAQLQSLYVPDYKSSYVVPNTPLPPTAPSSAAEGQR